MPRFRVCVTRNVTESVTVYVKADDADDARDLALFQVSDPKASYAWEVDEHSCGRDPSCVTGISEIMDAETFMEKLLAIDIYPSNALHLIDTYLNGDAGEAIRKLQSDTDTEKGT